jgi:hypothetical protein
MAGHYDGKVTRLDWEKAAKQEYVRTHGGVRAAPERPRLKPQETKTGRKLTADFRAKVRPIIREFRALTPEEQHQRLNRYCNQVNQLAASERAALSAYKQRFAAGIDKAARQATGEMRGIAGGTKKRGRSPLSRTPRRKRNPPVAPVVSGRAKKLLEELPEVRISHSREGSTLRLGWQAIEDVNGWFLTLGSGRNEPVYRQSFAAGVLTASVPAVADRPLTLTLVALRQGKPVARTQISIS